MQLRSSARPQVFALAALCIVLSAFAAPTMVRAAGGEYWSTIHAVVLAVDQRHRTLTIRHEALETVPAGIRTCGVRDIRLMRGLRGGEVIEARAETSQAAWILDAIRVVARSGASRRPLTTMALR